MRVAYRAARVFDGVDLRSAPQGVAVVVRDGQIEGMAVGAGIPAEAALVDLGDATILPGLIDVHVHLTWDSAADTVERVDREPAARTVLCAMRHAAQQVHAGVTAVRDLGSRQGLAVDIASAIDDGLMPGPRVIAAGRPITMTGGHVYQIGHEADGPDGVRRAVRQELKAGAECVKLMASSGALDGAHGKLGAPQLSVQEMAAAVDEAHKAGRRVAAHAHSRQSIINALAAGVQSIEHGTHLDGATAHWMHCTDVFLVPTLSPVASILKKAQTEEFPGEFVRNIAALAEHNMSAFRIALQRDVPIAAGSDSGVPGQRHGSLPDEVVAMVDAGAATRQALQAATVQAAGLLGILDEHGTLEPGKRADLLVVDGDPLIDIRSLYKVRMVVLNGRVIPLGDDLASPAHPESRSIKVVNV